MNGRTLLDAMAQLGEEPETIQQIRKMLVALAMTGKLPSRVENAPGTSSLLSVIENGTHARLKKDSLRRTTPLPMVGSENLLGGLFSPEGFVRLDAIARVEKGRTGITSAHPGPYPLVVTAEQRASCDHFDFDEAAAIVPLVSSTGHGKASLNRLHYQEGKFALGNILAAVIPHDTDITSARFLFEYLSAFKDELLVSQMIGTANVALSIAKVAAVPVPLVAISEQRKIDDLMASAGTQNVPPTGT